MTTAQLTSNIVFQSPDALRPHPRNARTHPKRQIKQVADSIKAFGHLVPILIDEAGTVLAGHARLAAAKLIGLATVPTIVASGLTDAQKRAFMIADNKLTQNGGWDREMLAVELGELSIQLPTLELDISVTGFEAGEIDAGGVVAGPVGAVAGAVIGNGITGHPRYYHRHYAYAHRYYNRY